MILIIIYLYIGKISMLNNINILQNMQNNFNKKICISINENNRQYSG